MLDVAIQHRVPIVLMHMRGTPQTMQSAALYSNTKPIIETVAEELLETVQIALRRGVYPWQIITDPGIGFAKTGQQIIQLLKDLPRWKDLLGKFGVLVGTSRKRFIGEITHKENPKDRTFGNAAVVTACIAAGANILRGMSCNFVTVTCD